jgi:hypothetical protein
MIIGIRHSWRDLGAVLTVASNKKALQFSPLQLITRRFFRQLNWSIIISEFSFIKDLMKTGGQFAETFDGRVVVKWLPNVIYLSPLISASRVGQEKDTRNGNGFWRDVEKRSVGLLPYAVEFGVDQNTRPLPNSPANNLLPTIGSNLLRKNLKAFAGWRTLQRTSGHIDRFWMLNNASAERENIRLNQLGRSH